MAIPKVIHYFWVGGGEIPENYLKCIESWKKYCPDYEIKCWNEENYNVNKNTFIKEAYKNRKFAFVSDYARLDIIYNHGGIYFDVDVEVIKNIDSLLEHKGFLGLEQGEGKYYVNSGLGFGAEKNLPLLKDIMSVYENSRFILPDGSFNRKPCPVVANEVLQNKKNLVLDKDQFYYVDDFVIYPTEYFAPKDYLTGEINVTEKTMTIHHYAGSWADEPLKLYQKCIRRIKAKASYMLAGCVNMFKKGEK